MAESSMTSHAVKRAWIDIAFAGLAFALALATAWQSWANRSLQADLAAGQEQLARAQTLASLDNNLIQLMAKAAVENNDGSMRELLSRNGVTLKAGATPQAAPEPSTDSTKQDR